MARLPKNGVDYFPHFVGSRDAKMLYILKSKFGNDGYAFWYQLLEMLGAEKELYYSCEKQANWLYLTASTGVSEELAEDILNMLVELDAIDSELWLSHRIIWCQDFVDQLDPIYRKRRQETPSKPTFYNAEEEVSTTPDVESKLTALPDLSSRNEDDTEPNNSPQDEIAKSTILEKQIVVSADTKRSRTKEDIPKSYPYVSEELKGPFYDWLKYKSLNGQPYKSDMATKMCYDQLVEYSKGDTQTATEIIRTSIANNYSGFFQPRKNSVVNKEIVPSCLVNANAAKVGVNKSTI